MYIVNKYSVSLLQTHDITLFSASNSLLQHNLF